MKPKDFRIPIPVATLLGAVWWLLGGCSSEQDVKIWENTLPEDDTYCVSIAIDGADYGETRSNPGEDSEDTGGEWGTEDENFIDINDLYIMTFSIPSPSAEGEDAPTELTGESELLEVIWNGKSGGKGTDTSIFFNGNTAFLHTWLSSNIGAYDPAPGNDFCLVAIANFSQFKKSEAPAFNLKEGMTFSQLQSALKYKFAPQTAIAADKSWTWLPYTVNNKGVKTRKGIPMFGVKRVNLKGYNHEVHNVANPYNLETVWMLRAFAKVEISLSEDLFSEEVKKTLGNVAITNAGISKMEIGEDSFFPYASNFMLIPELGRMSGFGKVGDEKGTGGTGQINKVPSSTGITAKSRNSLSFTISSDKKTAVLYIPETPLLYNEEGAGEDNRPEITMTLSFTPVAQTSTSTGQTGNDSSSGSGQTAETIPSQHVFKFKIKRWTDDDANDDDDNGWWQYLLRNHSYYFKVTVDFKIISAESKNWSQAFENQFNFG